MDWLSNLIFVKTKEYQEEDEYRIILNDSNYDPYKEFPTRDQRISIVKNIIYYGHTAPNSYNRPNFDRKYINKVYYNHTIKNETTLIETLKKYNIPFEKIEI